MEDNTKRFSDRVDNYQKYRPSYTVETIDYIFSNFNVTRTSVFADIGSGTGIFTEKLLEKGNPVFAVEPNQQMRCAAEKNLSKYVIYKSINGTSEHTTLGDKSIDCITVAQAFHWFNMEKTRIEFQRILRNNAYVFLIWNKRVKDTPFLHKYEEILQNTIPEYKKVNHNNITAEIIKSFLTSDYKQVEFANNQVFTLDGVLGRLNSSSYTPRKESKEYIVIEKEIVNAFNQYSIDGFVSFNYFTEVYSGKIT